MRGYHLLHRHFVDFWNRDMPMLHRLKRNLFAAYWLMLGAALLALGGATGFYIHIERGRVESREQARLLTQARVVQENVEQNLAAVNRVLTSLRKDLLRHEASRDLNGRLRMLTDAMPGIRTFLLLDGMGTVSASSRPELVGKNFAYRDYFKIPRQNPDPEVLFVSAPFMTTLGIYGINIVRVIPGAKGEFAGIIVATLDPEHFKTLMTSVLYAPDMWAAIAHGDGMQFLMVPEREGQSGKNLAQPGSFFTRHRDSGKEVSILTGTVYATGEKRMMALRSIQPASLHQDKPLVIAVGRDLDTVYAIWRRDTQIQAALLGLIVLGSTLGLYAYQRRQREFFWREAQVAEALAASERFMKTLTDNIPGMVAYWTHELRCGFANKAYFEWFGKTPEQMRDIRIQDMMGEKLFHQNEPFIQAVLRGEPQHFERTLTKADGSVGYTWAQYIPDLQGGWVRGFFVLVSDITALKRTEIALRESEWKLKTIIEAEPECVKVLATDGTVLQMNRAGLEMIEADSESQVIGHPVAEIVAPPYRQAFGDLNERVNRGETGILEFEIIGLKGGHRWLETHAAPMRDIDGKIVGLLGVTRDVTAHKQAEQELKQFAQTDFLTGLANRRYFMVLAEQEVLRTLRYGGGLSVFMMDIDHFKAINDTYGHKTGDVILQRFAGVSRKSLRELDTIGRVGGEEFAVLLPQTDSEHALEVAERLRKSVADIEVVLDHGLPLRITVSIGVTTMAGISTNIDTLLNQADQALYKAKNTGRNRVCIYEHRNEAG